MADQEQTNPEAPAVGQGQQDPGGSAQTGAAKKTTARTPRPAARKAATGEAAAVKKTATATTAAAKKAAAGTTGAARKTAASSAGAAKKAAAPRPATGKRAAAKRTVRGVQKQAESVAGAVTSAVDSVTGSGAPENPMENRLSPKRLSGFDFATWRSAVADPVMRSPIIGLIALEASPDWDRLVERFEHASRLAPILRQKVVEGPSEILSPRIVVDPEFDLSFHMRRYRVPDPGNWDQVLDEVRRQSMADFDLARPLWRFTVLEGLEGGRAVIILKLHHAIADGQGAMMIGASMIDLSPEYEDLGPLPEAPVSETLDTAGFLGNAVNDASSFLMKSARELAEAALPVASRALKDPVGLVEDLVNVLRSVSRFAALPSRPMSTIMVGRSINYHFETFDIPLDSLKAASKAHGPGLTLNDAFIAGVTGGMRLYHERRNEPVSALRCNMPISLRQPDKQAQNAVTIARFEVPVDILDPAERMRAIHAIVDQWRSEPALHLVDPLAEVGFRLLPSDVVTSAAQKSDFTASNVPGVPIPVYIGGARVTRMYPMTGTIGAATNITLLSYNGNAALGVSMDDAAIPDRELFAECLAAGFAEVVGHPVGRGDPLKD